METKNTSSSNNQSFIMSTPVNTSSTDSQMHNNIMAAGSKDRPPMLGPGRYSQWRSRFLRYIDTKPNGGGLKKCILNGPYVPTSVLIQAVPEAEGRPAVQQHTAIETVLNMTPENKEHFQSEKEAIFLLLTGIGDEIYSTVDACNTANEMWIAIERLQQGESLNVQDVKTNLFWEFGKFTSRDGESMESYYSRFYKLMNELTRNNLQVTTMQVNVQFLQQLQPEWSRFVTIVKQAENARYQTSYMMRAMVDRMPETIWVPTGKTFASSTTKVESEPPNGSNADIPNQCESEQALNVSAGTLLSTDLAPQRQEMSVENVSSGLVPQGQKASDYDNSDPVPPRQNVVPTAEKTDSSQQGLEFLFSPLLEEYYNPTHGLAEENNNPNASFQEAKFINPFCTRVQEIGESSSRNIDNTDVHSFQPQSHDYR
ncbi:hypothetical protein Tco_1104843 [Tanacetum coccineum]